MRLPCYKCEAILGSENSLRQRKNLATQLLLSRIHSQIQDEDSGDSCRCAGYYGEYQTMNKCFVSSHDTDMSSTLLLVLLLLCSNMNYSKELNELLYSNELFQ